MCENTDHNQVNQSHVQSTGDTHNFTTIEGGAAQIKEECEVLVTKDISSL